MPSPTAAEILERTRKLYATCRTYVDEGQASVRQDGIDLPRVAFRTAFTRRGRVRFDCQSGEVGTGSSIVRACLISVYGDARVWTTRSESTSIKEGTLRSELHLLAALSNGSSKLIPAILFPLMRYWPPLPEPSTAAIVGNEMLDDSMCCRIAGRSSDDLQSVVAWIDGSMALRQVRSSMETTFESNVPPLDMIPGLDRTMLHDLMCRDANGTPRTRVTVWETTARWRPRFDVDIDPATFEFTPPG